MTAQIKTANNPKWSSNMQDSQGFAQDSMIVGLNANYSPRYYFVWRGEVFLRQSFEASYKNGFKYKFIDILKR